MTTTKWVAVLGWTLCSGAAGLASAGQPPKSGAEVYKEVCMVCHATGVANAPRFSDGKAWAPLIKEGQAVVTAHGWVGLRGMPPKGGRPDLGLEEFARAVAYMASASGGNWKDPDAALLAAIRKEEVARINELKAQKK
jgi:cytochrome c5